MSCPRNLQQYERIWSIGRPAWNLKVSKLNQMSKNWNDLKGSWRKGRRRSSVRWIGRSLCTEEGTGTSTGSMVPAGTILPYHTSTGGYGTIPYYHTRRVPYQQYYIQYSTVILLWCIMMFNPTIGYSNMVVEECYPGTGLCRYVWYVYICRRWNVSKEGGLRSNVKEDKDLK